MSEASAINTMSFEDAMGELETIVKSLENGSAPLEESITHYERGIALKKHCEGKLRAAQEKIEKITISENGTASTTPLDPQD